MRLMATCSTLTTSRARANLLNEGYLSIKMHQMLHRCQNYFEKSVKYMNVNVIYTYCTQSAQKNSRIQKSSKILQIFKFEVFPKHRLFFGNTL